MWLPHHLACARRCPRRSQKPICRACLPSCTWERDLHGRQRALDHRHGEEIVCGRRFSSKKCSVGIATHEGEAGGIKNLDMHPLPHQYSRAAARRQRRQQRVAMGSHLCLGFGEGNMVCGWEAMDPTVRLWVGLNRGGLY
jgi:hypothetical protein